MNIDELYDPEFRKLIKAKKPTVIIPIGSIEQHGAHLPISTDSDIVTEIASCLLYTSPSPRDYAASRMPSSA